MKKQFTSMVAFLLALVLLIGSAAAAGDAADPAISQSYLEQVFSGAFLSEVSDLTRAEMHRLEAATLQTLASDLAYARLDDQLRGMTVSGAGVLRTKQQDSVTVAMGTRVTVTGGTLRASGSGWVDVTAGTAIAGGEILTVGHSFLSSDDRSGYLTQSVAAAVAYQGVYTLSASTLPDYNSRADALYALGLFRGTDFGYELERSATRIEALVMFLRILGLEEEALASTADCPFTDVPSWASRYAAYAYQQGLALGDGTGRYLADQRVTAQDYMTFLMRALGYQENSEFSWANAVADAVRLGVLTSGEQQTIEQGSFLRAHMAYLSWQALMTQKTDGQLLLCMLRDRGTVSRAQVAAAICAVTGDRIP